jgi:hypothetical protein
VNTENLDLVPLQKAGLCLDCDTITAAHTTCLACGSRAVLNIARVLSRSRTSGVSRTERARMLQISPARIHQRTAFYRSETTLDRGLAHGEPPPASFGAEHSA